VGIRLILALLLSFALWIFVSYTQNPDRRVRFDNISVETVDLAPGLVLVDSNGLPRTTRPTVSISVEGASDDLQNVSESDLRAYQDLSDLGPGQHIPDVRVESIRSDQVRLRFTPDPQSLPIRIEQEITRTVELTVTVSGRVPFSFRASDPSVTFGGQSVISVTVRGPQSRVERVAFVRASADIDRLTSTYDSPRALEALTDDGRVIEGVTLVPALVNVRVPIEPTVGLKRVPIVPTLVGEPASGFIVTKISVDPPIIELTGSSLDEIDSVSTAAINITGATSTFTATAVIVEPFGARLSSGVQGTAIVRIEVQVFAQPAQIALPLPIRVIEIPDGYQVALSPATATFTLQGLPVSLAQIDATTLSGVVSARGLTAGTYTLTPELAGSLPRGVTLAGAAQPVSLTLVIIPTPTIPPTETSVPDTTPEITPTALPSETTPTPTPTLSPPP
jgi:YbbR domain-containing protein